MNTHRKSWLERFESAYPMLINGMLSAGNVVMTMTQTIIVSFGLLIILFALMVVEQRGVQDGIFFFMPDIGVASFAALAIVGLNLVIEFQIVHIEREEGYKRQAGNQWSWRLAKQNLTYRMGKGKDWKARKQSPAFRFINLRLLIGIIIFAVALIGRMHLSIETASEDNSGKPVYAADGIQNLIHKSTLADMLKWLAGTLVTMGAVVSVQALTHHMAKRVGEIQDDLKKRVANIKAAATRARQRDERREREQRLSVNDVNLVNLRKFTTDRPCHKLQKAIDYFAEHPEHLQTSSRELETLIGVSHMTINKAQRMILSGDA